MPERASFGQVTLGAAADLLVPAASVEQRVIVTLTTAGNARVGTSAAQAQSPTGYVVQSTAESYFLAPHQALYGAAVVPPQALSVYVAPTEDDYLESGRLLWQDES